MPRHLESLAFYLSASECLVEGEGSGVVSVGSPGIAADPTDADPIDRHHSPGAAFPAGRALVIGRGEGPEPDRALLAEALLEAIQREQAPALVVLDHFDTGVALAAIVAEEVLSRPLPVIVLDPARFAMARSAHVITLQRGRQLVLSGPNLAGIASVTGGGELGHEPLPTLAANDGFSLSPEDRRDLEGASGPAVQIALRVVLRMARLQGAVALIDVTEMAIDAGVSAGPVGAAIVERLIERGGTVRVPTTVVAANATPSFVAACRALGATVVDASVVDASATLSVPTRPWPLALCVAISGRAPAMLAG